MLTFTDVQLRRVSESVFKAAQVPAHTASLVARSLVESNLVGHDSHGVLRVTSYLGNLRSGAIVADAVVEIVSESATTAALDGHNAFGQVAAARCMEVAISKAKQSHLAAVTLRHSGHIGRLGEWAMMAAEQGLIGIVLCNSTLSAVAHGGKKRVLSTNPMAIAAPGSEGNSFLLDMATTVSAEGKLRVARSKGEQVPPGWIVDKEGRPTQNPADYYAGGALLPMAGHKGYGLSLFIELTCGLLSGHGSAALPGYGGGNGVFMLALDVEAFAPLSTFVAQEEELFDIMRAGPLAPGFSEILIPGDYELRMKEKRLREGIPLPESTWEDLRAAGIALGVDVDGISAQ